MAMDTGIRRQLLNMVGNTIADLMFFNAVHYDSPTESFPSALDTPIAYIVRQPESLDDLTNSEKHSDFPFDVVAFVHSPNELELLKTDAQDEIESALMALQVDADFTAIATMIKVHSADPTATALADLGITIPVMPPYGVVRLRCGIIFDYNVR